MTPIVLAILATVCIAAAGFALLPQMLGASRAEQRLDALRGETRPAPQRRINDAERQREGRRKSVQQALKAQADLEKKRRRRVPLADLIFQAGMKISRFDFIRNQVILGVILFLLTAVLQVPVLFAAVFGIAGGYLLPRLVLAQRRRRYQDRFLDELPNAVEAIVRGVKSGMPLNDSIRVVARDVKEPVRSEFQRVLDQQSVGKSMAEAVETLLDRVPLPEVNFFVVVITVQQQAGGNLSEALGNLARVLRNRKKMKDKVKAMSSEAKASAMIIGSLPFAVGILVSLTTPTYLAPLFTTPLGLFWVGVGTLMMLTGIFVMYRMIQFEM
ncbi:type II secretion system F family protein [Arsenicitalea aurantiaca]|uniref:Type II secretion system F family protein n=1 Tax=Arsenicitalea aurantiaca TaxID=1783274 RepID=A0A433X259_9HYPH|nr:type II secretion system F family protein [Arsenicitalea aurantiaca]RUT28199.1 type II secretion system F family protein [Arsenicitalea aurantiaca]